MAKTSIMPCGTNRFIKFLLAGLPAFLFALPMNYILVEHAGVAIPVSYMIVLCIQVTINFFICRRFVFVPHPDVSIVSQFGQFFAGIILFRVADWGLYTLMTSAFGLYYIGVQVANILVFAVLKYRFSKWVIERVKHPPPY